MSNVIDFDFFKKHKKCLKIEQPVEFSFSDPDDQSRLARLRESLNRINELMIELKRFEKL